MRVTDIEEPTPLRSFGIVLTLVNAKDGFLLERRESGLTTKRCLQSTQHMQTLFAQCRKIAANHARDELHTQHDRTRTENHHRLPITYSSLSSW